MVYTGSTNKVFTRKHQDNSKRLAMTTQTPEINSHRKFMAVYGSWLHNVIVIFTIFRISCAQFDDLLDRVEVSRSNDPEVRDFLKSVLKHHNDFRWIQGEVTKINRADHMLPLNGVPLKNKRAFFSSSSNSNPVYRNYGYKMIPPSRHPDSNGGEDYATDEDQSDERMGDIYPYEETMLRLRSRKTGGSRQASSGQAVPYEDKSTDDDNGYFVGGNEGSNNDVVSLADDDQHLEDFDYAVQQHYRMPEMAIDKRNLNPNDLLQEKIILHNILYKNKDRAIANKDGAKRGDGSRNVILSSNTDDVVGVFPNSEKGVLYAPGHKIEKYSVAEVLKRDCGESNEDHDFVVPNLFNQNDSRSEDAPLGEFYFSGPHDILGIDQDVAMEQKVSANATCKKFKKKARMVRSILSGIKQTRKEKAIKIKIFDNAKMVRDIQRGGAPNSIILSIENNEKGGPKIRASSITDFGNKKLESDLLEHSSDSNNLVSKFESDDTLQKIDLMLQHDTETLKHNPQPLTFKYKKEVKGGVKNNNKEESDNEHRLTKNSARNPSKAFSNSYQRINEIGTKVAINGNNNEPFLDDLERLQRKSDNVIETQSTEEKQNKLEDQTEPTSAAEQRELGKIDNKFSTEGMNVATEKVLVIPLKKSLNVTHKYDEDEAEKIVETRNINNVLLDNSFKEEQNVLGDLQKRLNKLSAADFSQNYFENEGSLKLKDLSRSRMESRINEDASDEDLENDSIKFRQVIPQVPKSDGDFEEKSQSIKSRKILSVSEELNQNIIPTSTDKFVDQSQKGTESKRDIRTVLGMTNDEDYSEDKTDLFEPSRKDKPMQGKVKKDYKKSKKEPKLMKTSQEKRVLDIRHAMTKHSKSKRSKEDEENQHFKLNIFTNNFDRLQKRENIFVPRASDRLPDRCCTDHEENSKCGVGKPESDKSDIPTEENETPAHHPPAGGGNELDIIEKTQAILLHFTSNPSESVLEATTTAKTGEFDESDDTSSKLEAREGPSGDTLAVKRLNTYKVSDSMEGSEDVVGAIMKLVNSYKESLNNKKEMKQEHKECDRAEENETPSFAHHLHKEPKAHPLSVNANKCAPKPSSDHDQSIHYKHISDQDVDDPTPKEVREGYFKPDETNIKGDSDVETGRCKRTQRDENNPFRFTPDSVRGFEKIVERENSLENEESADNNQKRGTRKKRYLNSEYSQALHTDEEIDRLLAMDADNDESGQRYRRFKNYYEPFYYESFPRYRQQATTYFPTTVTVVNKVGTESNGSTKTANESSCAVDDLKKLFDSHETSVKSRKKAKKKHKGSLKESEYGNSVLLTMDHGKKSKQDQQNTNMIREKTREKINSDNLMEKQKEQQHMKNVLNGHLMLDIMDKFQLRIKDNHQLNSRFGFTMGRHCAGEKVQVIDAFRDDQSRQDVRHAQLMLHQVIVMLNKIVADQVHRRTCLVLSPELQAFLKKVATPKGTVKSKLIAEGYPLPQIQGMGNGEGKPMDKQSAFLFQRPDSKKPDMKDDSLEKKIHLIKRLLNKYNHMSQTCQIKVDPVKDYLVEHLRMLEQLNQERKHLGEESICTISPNYLAKCPGGTKASLEATTVASAGSSSGSPGSTAVTSSPGTSTAKAVRGLKSDTSGRPIVTHSPRSVGNSVAFNENHFFLNRANYELGDHKNTVSDKYKKLLDAADSYRRKRQIEERLARLFGRKKGVQKFKKDTDERDGQVDDINEVAFEAPIVYSLDN